MHKALRRFTTILLLSFFLIIYINFAVIAQDTQNKSEKPISLFSSIDLWNSQGGFRFLIFLIILFSIIVILVRCRDAFRSPGKEGYYYDKSQNKDELVSCSPDKKNPFSLSLSQLAWWTAIIILSYLAIFLFTGKFTNIFSSSATILLGINAGTPLINSLIDESKPEIKQKGSARTSESWLEDVLSDGNGFDFHRLQVAIWTFALGLVFIYEVINSSKMPDFDSSLLALQAINSATFIGLRTTEKQQNKDSKTLTDNTKSAEKKEELVKQV